MNLVRSDCYICYDTTPTTALTTEPTSNTTGTATPTPTSTQIAFTLPTTGNVNDIPVADFTSNITSGPAPLTVRFTDTSTHSPTAWRWEFGDGNISELQNPLHKFEAEGTYTVRLTAANEAGMGTVEKEGYVTVTEEQVSNQATDIAGISTKESEIEYVAAKQQEMNYNPTTLILPTSSDTIKARLSNDEIFFFTGHGAAGYIMTSGTSGYAAKNTSNGHNFDDTCSSYSKMKLAVFFGCNTGNTDPEIGNLVDVVVSKGAGCAMGWTDLIVTDASDSWSSAFWDALQNGTTIEEAHNAGLNEAKEDSLCKALEGPSDNPNKYQYCLFENLYSQGSGCSQSLPTGTTDQSVMGMEMKQFIDQSSVQQSEPTKAIIQIKPYTLKEKQSIRKFSPDNTGTDLIYKKSTNHTYGELDTFTANNITYNVNRNTGRVQSYYNNEIEPTSGKNIIDIDQGSLISQNYANEKCPEFWEKQADKVVKKINQTAKDHELTYSWRQFFNNPNNTLNSAPEITGYNQIDVTLDARDGKVKIYHEWFIPMDTNLILNPYLSEEQAWESVKNNFNYTGTDINNATRKDNLGLVIALDDNNTQHLAWQFEIKQKNMTNSNDYGGQIIVDAQSGQIIKYLKFG